MSKFPFLALAAATALAACGGREPVTPAPQATTVAPQPTTVAGLNAGTGRVVSVSKLQGVPTTGNGTGPANRIGLQMDNGTAQYVDTRANLTVGERVEILADGRIRYSR